MSAVQDDRHPISVVTALLAAGARVDVRTKGSPPASKVFWIRGDEVVLKADIGEKNYLKKNQLAVVTWGPDRDDQYKVKRSSDGVELKYFFGTDLTTVGVLDNKTALGLAKSDQVKALLQDTRRAQGRRGVLKTRLRFLY